MEYGSIPNNELHDLFPSTGKMIEREKTVFLVGFQVLKGWGISNSILVIGSSTTCRKYIQLWYVCCRLYRREFRSLTSDNMDSSNQTTEVKSEERRSTRD